jgi:hypothetical protein
MKKRVERNYLILLLKEYNQTIEDIDYCKGIAKAIELFLENSAHFNKESVAEFCEKMSIRKPL